ncbi:HupE/UreJ family protein [Cyanobium sp. CH-040]|uniref:HupE/UreJ family protein n=1 Tax=Cyanobium sp. CH-040 TaxID=2823708 RepID=UPI0020CCE09A|nr:HupE/UreJ family protein [Cyanobium sp. CH-040]
MTHRTSPAAGAAGLLGRAALALGGSLALASVLQPSAALAHHPFEMAEGAALSPWMGFVSGLGHPLLGPDHLLFLLAIGFVGLRRPLAWVLPLLAAGLLGSALAQALPLSASVAPFAEALVALTLALAGLVALGRVPAALLLPAIALHGYLLGGMVVGAEPTPLLTYMLGLFIAQGALLLLVAAGSRALLEAVQDNGRRLLAGIWIGIGAAFAWSTLVP